MSREDLQLEVVNSSSYEPALEILRERYRSRLKRKSKIQNSSFKQEQTMADKLRNIYSFLLPASIVEKLAKFGAHFSTQWEEGSDMQN